MPRQTVLICDAPGCDQQGGFCRVELADQVWRVILCDKHRKMLEEIARWGELTSERPRRGGHATTTTDTERMRDLIVRDGNGPASKGHRHRPG